MIQFEVLTFVMAPNAVHYDFFSRVSKALAAGPAALLSGCCTVL
jgi:hypothetical protein